MKKAFKIFMVFIVALIIFIYISGVYLFKDRFLPRTFINGHDFGLTKISEFEDNYNNLSRNFVVDIVAKDSSNNEKIAAKDIGYVEKIGDRFVKQTPFYWPIESLINKNFTLDHKLQYDETRLNNKIENLKVVRNGTTPSKDAKVVYSDGKFSIEEEVIGDIVKKEDLKKAILNHFSDKKDKLNLAGEDLYYGPNITSDSEYLKSQLISYRDIYDKKLIIDLGGTKDEVTGQRMISMYSKTDEGPLKLDEEKVKNFVKELARTFDTYRTSRIFNATDIGKVKVDGGIYGWLTDIPRTTEAIINALNNGVESIEPSYKQTAMARGDSDLGNTYIEVDLARQTLWYYKDGALQLKTPVVTGNPRKGNGTPTGTDRIWSREEDRYLTGETYRSKVNYWMPINWSGIGLHDATWRSSFGGNIYLSGGSHGCINIPPKVMPGLFRETFNGMPVIVYDSNRQKV